MVFEIFVLHFLYAQEDWQAHETGGVSAIRDNPGSHDSRRARGVRAGRLESQADTISVDTQPIGEDR